MNFILKFIRFPQQEKQLFMEALFYLWFSRILLFFPFIKSSKIFKDKDKLDKRIEILELEKIACAVERANKIAIWKNKCLVKSYCARFMLQRRGIRSVIYLGLQFKKDHTLIAHAWLECNGVFLTPRGNNLFKEIYHF